MIRSIHGKRIKQTRAEPGPNLTREQFKILADLLGPSNRELAEALTPAGKEPITPQAISQWIKSGHLPIKHALRVRELLAERLKARGEDHEPARQLYRDLCLGLMRDASGSATDNLTSPLLANHEVGGGGRIRTQLEEVDLWALVNEIESRGFEVFLRKTKK